MSTLLARAALAGGLSLASLVAGARDCAAQRAAVPEDASPAAEEAVDWLWELDLAYGFGVDLSSDATSLGDVRFLAIAPRLGRSVGGVFAEESWYRGRVRVLVELPVLLSLEPHRGYAVGLSLLGRYTLAGTERWRPFGEIGAGPVLLDFNNERNQSDGLSFTLQAGGGVSYFLSPVWALVGRAHLHHISNAGLRKPNPGINDLLFSIGIARHRL